ncbi:hypothetical protein F4827_006368 [Paraburkholderia bannensis]|uniref:Type VI secretion protein n=1 Tax=Paraburkholderia bannensis TaxID=765414 RepID=A0A7W9U3V4_9BURK|nr:MULTISPECIES: type IV secretion system protein [Paraburkholderia]MBB3262379.1 hypothetical protein [Paraburkholderia sp. WP4_3_2]MBB6106493.1 hypothetical protein [Paraburkholderia bannensis]
MFRKLFLALLVAFAMGHGFVSIAYADDSPAEGQQIVPSDAPAPPASSPGKGANTVRKGEVAVGAAKATQAFNTLFSAIIPTAVKTSQNLKSEADKFAAGLGVITLVLTFVRFSATRDPTQAWVDAFEEVAILGIFASLYVGYQTFGAGFFGWFQKLAALIQAGAGSGVSATMAAASSAAYDAFMTAKDATSWYDVPALIVSMGPLLVAWLVLMVTSIVFAFMNNLGLIQAGVGIVMGQIAVALGFSSYTRGFFKAWLDWMISSGMYCVISAILSQLVAGSLNDAMTAAAAQSLSTSEGATYVMDLSFFVFLLSFEIPKMAGMFGGGASASGGMFSTAAKTAAKAAAFV